MRGRTGEELHYIWMSCKLEEEEIIRKPFTVKCAFMYNPCGIVKVEKYSYNKGEYFVSISHVIFPIKGNLKMSIMYCSTLNIDSN